MSVTPLGGGYWPMRCMTSGRLTPAAATLTSNSASPGCGTGRSCGTSTLGPPGAEMAIAVMRAGTSGMERFLLGTDDGGWTTEDGDDDYFLASVICPLTAVDAMVGAVFSDRRQRCRQST